MKDINCDLGESADFLKNGHDEALMDYVYSVNIACGYHAGDEYIMARTVENALRKGVKIGAHPGFNDKVNFGRKEIELSEDQLFELISEQLHALQKITGTNFHHVKPHGALYNMSAAREDYAKVIAEAVCAFDPNLILYGLSGSISISAAESAGLATYSEVFADRAYLANGKLAPRNLSGAVLEDENKIKSQINSLLHSRPVHTLDGNNILLRADTICIHSDTSDALKIAKIVSEIAEQS